MNAESYRKNGWKQLQIFEHYNRVRNYTRPALQKIAQETVLPNIPNKGTVLEYGAGIGELRHGLIGDSLPSDVTWIETEQNPDFLNARRAYTTQKQAANLQALPFSNQSADLITGYGVLDTIPLQNLPKALAELYRVCKTGGKLIEQLDLGIDLGEVFIKAEERQEVPFTIPFEIFPGIKGGQKVFFAKKEDLEKAFAKWEKDPTMSLKLPMIKLYIKNPIETHIRLEQRGSSDILKNIGEIVRSSVPITGEEFSATEWYKKNLEDASKNAGFKIESSENVRSEVIIDKKSVAELPPGKNTLLYKNGTSYFTNDGALRDPSKVKLDVSIYVFIARKGMEPTS